jgi:hypothetical protein
MLIINLMKHEKAEILIPQFSLISLIFHFSILGGFEFKEILIEI